MASSVFRKRLFRIGSVLLLISGFTSCSPQAESTDSSEASANSSSTGTAESVAYTVDSLESIKTMVENGDAVLLDVRSQGEWDESHLVVSTFIPIDVLSDDAQRADAIAGLDKGKPVYIHCAVGGRAKVAAEILAKGGFDVRPLDTEYAKFADAGYATESAATVNSGS